MSKKKGFQSLGCPSSIVIALAETRLLELPRSAVCLDRHPLQRVEECRRLALEKPTGGEPLDGSRCAAEFVGERANHGAVRQGCADEFAGNREDEIGLIKRSARRDVQGWERSIQHRSPAFASSQSCTVAPARRCLQSRPIPDSERSRRRRCRARCASTSRLETPWASAG